MVTLSSQTYDTENGDCDRFSFIPKGVTSIVVKYQDGEVSGTSLIPSRENTPENLTGFDLGKWLRGGEARYSAKEKRLNNGRTLEEDREIAEALEKAVSSE